jgi:hypothetical protein
VIEYYHLPSEQTSCAAPYRGREGKLCSRRNTNRHTGIFRRSKSDCAGMEGLGSQLLPHLSRAGLYVIAHAGRSSAVSSPHRLENCVTRLSVPAPRPSRVGNRWLPAHRGEGVAARGTRSSDRGARCRALLQDAADRASQGAHEDRRSVRYCFGFCCLSGPISWPSPVRGCRRATSAVRACPSCGPALVAEGLCLLARRFHRVQRRARARRRRAILRGLDSTVSSPPSSSGFSIFGAVGGADVPSFLSGRRITASSGLRQGQSLSHRV